MGGTLIPYPNVPDYPGVPLLARPLNAAIAESPILSIAIGSVENILIGALQQQSRWGIFDSDGNQLGISPNSQTSLQAIGGAFLSQLTGTQPTVLSTFGIDYGRESKVSSFPVEEGSFATYNKVQLPANPTVVLILDGSEDDRTAFLEAVDAATQSTDLFAIVTPEIVYTDYTLERYTYSRRASKGATLLMVEITLQEVRQVTAAYTTAAPAVVSPQDPAASAEENNGVTQPAVPDASTLKSLSTSISSHLASFFGGN